MDFNFLKSLDLNRYKREGLGSNLNFENVNSTLINIIKCFLEFENRSASLLRVEMNLVRELYDLFINYLTQIENFAQQFDESAANSLQRRNDLVSGIEHLKLRINSELLPILLNLKENDDEKFQALLKAFQEKITQFDNLVNSKIQSFDSQSNQRVNALTAEIQNVKQLSEEAIHIKNEAKNFSIDKIVQKYGQIFNNQSKTNRNIAVGSLVIFILFLVCLIVSAYYLLSPLVNAIKDISNPEIGLDYIIANSVFRLTLLIISSILVKESLKNYNINMHLYNLNKHRQNTLESFDILISNTDQTETRDMIVKEIAHTIYSNQDDGYLLHSSEKGINIDQAIDLIKTLK